MTTKPDQIKWVTDDSASKISDPGATKKLAGWLYKEKPAFQFWNWLLNRVHKWLLGLQGGFYDIVVGSSAQVTALEATHVVGDLNDTLVVAGSRVLLLDGTHTLGAALSLSNADLKIESESPLAILDVATFTATFSGARNKILLRVTNAGAGDVIVSGAGSIFEGIDLNIANVAVSNGAVAITSGTANGLSHNLNASNLSSGTLPDARLSSNVLTKTNTPLLTKLSAENTSIITVLSSNTTIITLDLGTVAVGDIFEIKGYALIEKGATGGRSNLRLVKSTGTGDGVFHKDLTAIYLDDESNHLANNDIYFSGSCYFEVTVAGTYVMLFTAQSLGSNSTIPIGGGQITAVQLYNA